MEQNAEHHLAELLRSYPLPSHWSLGEHFWGSTEIGRVTLYSVGLTALREGELGAFGSAAGLDRHPVERAFFELLERISIVDARAQRLGPRLTVRDADGTEKSVQAVSRVFPSDVRPNRVRGSLSNGVALHESWSEACAAARAELVERDRVLRAFQYARAPTPLEQNAALEQALAPHYRVRGYEFEAGHASPQHRVAGVFLFPLTEGAPLAYGFGAGTTLDPAIERARREALQRLAFLWGEPLPAAPPDAAPLPDYHQDYYLYPPHVALLTEWLDAKAKRAQRTPAMFDGSPVRYIDITPVHLRGKLAVAKAMSPRARQLRFGANPRSKRGAPHPIA
jgi:hypothetical protein